MDQRNQEKEAVKQELENLKEHVAEYTAQEIQSGEWFIKFLSYALNNYTEQIDAVYFQRKYPTLSMSSIVDHRIELAKKHAAIEAPLTPEVHSTAVAATIGSAGGSRRASIPKSVLSFIVDLFYTTQLQLRLAYDLSVLHKYPLDVEDPEDLFDLVKVAFGFKIGELIREAVIKAIPETVQQGVKETIKCSPLAWLKALPVVGLHLLQRNIIKFKIPFVSVPLATGVNSWSLESIAQVAQQIYGDRAAIDQKAQEFAKLKVDELLLLKTLWMIVRTNGKTSSEESWLLSGLTTQLEQESEGQATVEEFEEIIELNVENLLSDLRQLDPQEASEIFKAACYTAAVDHEFDDQEEALLLQVAAACRVEYHEKVNTHH